MLDPTQQAQSQYQQGVALYESRRYAEALACFVKVGEAEPEHLDAHWNECITRLMLGDFLIAASMLEIAPEFPDTTFVLFDWEGTPTGKNVVAVNFAEEEGSFLGQSALTRQPVLGSAYAIGEVTTVHVGRDKMADLVQQNPHLLQELGRTIEKRRADVRAALEQSADTDVVID